MSLVSPRRQKRDDMLREREAWLVVLRVAFRRRHDDPMKRAVVRVIIHEVRAL